MVREERGEESQDDSWSFLLWMGMRVILRIQRIERPAGAVRWLRNVQRLEVLRGVFQDLENRRVPREEIDRFVMHMADLSEDEDEDLTNGERECYRLKKFYTSYVNPVSLMEIPYPQWSMKRME